MASVRGLVQNIKSVVLAETVSAGAFGGGFGVTGGEVEGRRQGKKESGKRRRDGGG